MKWKYTNIQHPARIKMGLTPNEYCVLDIIYQSQSHPKFSKDGWTNAGCHRIAGFLGFSTGTVHKMLERFENWGLLEFKNGNKSFKRTTKDWYNVAYLEQSDVQKVNVQKVNRGCSKSEQSDVQKVNTNRSKSEHIIKGKYNTETKYKESEEKSSPSPGKKKNWYKAFTDMLEEEYLGKGYFSGLSKSEKAKEMPNVKSLLSKLAERQRLKSYKDDPGKVETALHHFLSVVKDQRKQDKWIRENVVTVAMLNSQFTQIVERFKSKRNGVVNQQSKIIELAQRALEMERAGII
jgi:transposase-like protein